ncbi:alpha/beta hydrolase, partial [Rhodosalinus sp.]|uniref:alpha/beta hydrolase n=1 Tax=Rhodosalinus sp. TaxID=2047741 RepID=UPI003564B15B
MTPAPLLDEMTDAPPGAAWWVRASDGVRLRVGGWRPGRAEGTVLLFPGRTEYIEKYGRPARDFLAAGLAVLAVDWRGQGMADRAPEAPFLGHVRAFADYQHDVTAMLEVAEAQGFPRPFHLLG